MRVLAVLMVLGLAGGVNWWVGRPSEESTLNADGFVNVEMPQRVASDTVLILSRSWLSLAAPKAEQ